MDSVRIAMVEQQKNTSYMLNRGHSIYFGTVSVRGYYLSFTQSQYRLIRLRDNLVHWSVVSLLLLVPRIVYLFYLYDLFVSLERLYVTWLVREELLKSNEGSIFSQVFSLLGISLKARFYVGSRLMYLLSSVVPYFFHKKSVVGWLSQLDVLSKVRSAKNILAFQRVRNALYKYAINGVLYIVGTRGGVMFTVTDVVGNVKYWECPNSLERMLHGGVVGSGLVYKKRKIRLSPITIVECGKYVYSYIRRLNYRCLRIVVRGFVPYLNALLSKLVKFKGVFIYSLIYDSMVSKTLARRKKMRWKKRRHVFYF